MSYKIEINADTLNELGGKLLALASQFHSDPVMPEVRGHTETEAKKTRRTKDKSNEPAADAGNAAQSAELTTEHTAAETSEATTDGTSTAPADAEPAALDFEKDVAPVVIDAAGKIGKEGVTGVLSQFGAARASEVNPAQWGELVDALKDKVA